jgi:HEAT repeats
MSRFWKTRSIPLKFISLIIFFVILALFDGSISFLSASDKSSSVKNDSKFDITYFNGLISINAKDADIKELLIEISKNAKLDYVVDSQISETISIRLVNVPVEMAIKRIAKNWAIVYAVDPLTGLQKIEKIGVFDTSTTSSQNLLTKYFKEKPKSDLLDKSSDLRARMESVQLAFQTPDQQTKEALRYLLLDKSEPRSLRIKAARSLVKAKELDSIILIKEVIDQTDDNNLKYGLASALGEINHPKSISILSNYAKTANNSTLRYKSIQSLMKINDLSSIDTFKHSAINDPDKYNRAKAVIALGSIGDDDLIPFIESLKDEEKDEFVKHVCQKQIDFLSE